MATLGDVIQPFQIDGLGLRGRLVRLGPAAVGALQNHGYPDAVARLMGEAMALTAVLASSLKYDGIFTLQTQSDGPVSLMVSDLTSDGVLRGYARVDVDTLPSGDGGAKAMVPKFLGAGHLAFTVDQGRDMERYQGITALEGATLTDCANAYFRHSEQLATAVTLVSDPVSKHAAALMLQQLPAADEGAVESAAEAWRRGVILMSSVTEAELLDGNLATADLLFRLFHEDGVRLFDPKPVRHGCRCSHDKVAGTLKSFPRDEIASLADDGVVSVTCEFCKTDYLFDEAALEALFAG